MANIIPAVAPPVTSILGPIKIDSESGVNGYSIAIVFILDAGSTSTFTGFMKYGAQTNLGTVEWYDYGTLASHAGGALDGTGYVITDAGKTLTVHFIDNVRGDAKLDGPDGKIDDPALLVVKAAAVFGATPIPTLSIWGLLLLTSLLGIFGFKARNMK